MRLIDADALKERFRNTTTNGINLEIDKFAIKCIDDAPTIKIERKGEWVFEPELSNKHIEPFFSCSECKYMAWGIFEKTNYCPNCGSDMRGSTNDEK